MAYVSVGKCAATLHPLLPDASDRTGWVSILRPHLACTETAESLEPYEIFKDAEQLTMCATPLIQVQMPGKAQSCGTYAKPRTKHVGVQVDLTVELTEGGVPDVPGVLPSTLSPNFPLELHALQLDQSGMAGPVVVATMRDKPLLIHNGYAYTVRGRTKSTICWKCRKRSMCKARVHTDNISGDGLKVLDGHTHPGDLVEAEVLVAMSRLRSLARSAMEPESVVVNTLDTLSDSARANMPSMDSMKRTVRRKRPRGPRRLRPPVVYLQPDAEGASQGASQEAACGSNDISSTTTPVIIATVKGKPLLIYAGHAYTTNKQNKSFVYWSCRRRKTCRARICTNSTSGNVVKLIGLHTHKGDPVETELLVAGWKLRNLARSAMSVPQVVQNVVGALSSSAEASMPLVESLRCTVESLRRHLSGVADASLFEPKCRHHLQQPVAVSVDSGNDSSNACNSLHSLHESTADSREDISDPDQCSPDGTGADSRENTSVPDHPLHKADEETATVATNSTARPMIVMTPKERPLLVYEGHAYTMNKRNTSSTCWGCHKGKKCSAQLFTDSDNWNVVKTVTAHTHPADPIETEVLVAGSRLRNLARSTLPVTEVVRSVMEELSSPAKAIMPTEGSLKCTVHRLRRFAAEVNAMSLGGPPPESHASATESPPQVTCSFGDASCDWDESAEKPDETADDSATGIGDTDSSSSQPDSLAANIVGQGAPDADGNSRPPGEAATNSAEGTAKPLIVDGQKNKPLLIHAGYSYTVNREGKSTVHWVCRKREICCARINTSLEFGEVIRVFGKHTHQADPTEVEVLLAGAKFRSLLRSGMSAGEIIDKTLEGLSPSARARMPLRNSMVRTVRRSRQRSREAEGSPLNASEESRAFALTSTQSTGGVYDVG